MHHSVATYLTVPSMLGLNVGSTYFGWVMCVLCHELLLIAGHF
jgi:hypothetical protein